MDPSDAPSPSYAYPGYTPITWQGFCVPQPIPAAPPQHTIPDPPGYSAILSRIGDPSGKLSVSPVSCPSPSALNLGSSSGAFRPPERGAAGKREALKDPRPPDPPSPSSPASTPSPGSPRTKTRSRIDIAENSTVCTSGLSEVEIPHTGPPQCEAVIALRRKNKNEEYLLKLKGRSYLKARWWTRDEAESSFDAKKLRQKVKKHCEERGVEPFVDYDPGEDDLFPASYAIMERVIAINEEYDRALVKWKGLEYVESTWESLDEVPTELLTRYTHHAKGGGPFGDDAVPPLDLEYLRDYQKEGVAWLKG
eukprot:Sspe_Gene.118825::Locus_113222_Transcript_1_1_Confidence_1.000_Length_977::g.118825::m.118825